MSSARLQKIFQDLRPIIDESIAIKIESDIARKTRQERNVIVDLLHKDIVY